MVLGVPAICVFELFWDPKRLDIKAYVGFVLIGLCMIAVILVIINLRIKFMNLMKAIFILDSILISLSITVVAFIGMMKYLDRNKW